MSNKNGKENLSGLVFRIHCILHRLYIYICPQTNNTTAVLTYMRGRSAESCKKEDKGIFKHCVVPTSNNNVDDNQDMEMEMEMEGRDGDGDEAEVEAITMMALHGSNVLTWQSIHHGVYLRRGYYDY
jgi:hypothetical protein